MSQDTNEVYVLRKKNRYIGVMFVADKNITIDSSMTYDIEKAQIYYTKQSAKLYLNATVPFWERLFHWDIVKVDPIIFENTFNRRT